jgi:hypothetical protein
LWSWTIVGSLSVIPACANKDQRAREAVDALADAAALLSFAVPTATAPQPGSELIDQVERRCGSIATTANIPDDVRAAARSWQHLAKRFTELAKRRRRVAERDEQLALGTDRFKQLLDRIEKLADKPPPVIRLENIAAAARTIQRLTRVKDPRTAAQAQTAVSFYDAIVRYANMAAKRPLTPGELADMQAKAAGIAYVLRAAGTLYADAEAEARGRAIQTGVVVPLKHIASKENIERTAAADAMAAGWTGLREQVRSKVANTDILTQTERYAKTERHAEARRSEAVQLERALKRDELAFFLDRQSALEAFDTIARRYSWEPKQLAAAAFLRDFPEERKMLERQKRAADEAAQKEARDRRMVPTLHEAPR